MAHKVTIEQMSQAGHTLRTIYDEVAGLSSMSYPVFTHHVRKYLKVGCGSAPQKNAFSLCSELPKAVSDQPDSETAGSEKSEIVNTAGPRKLDISSRVGSRFNFDSNAGNEIMNSMKKDKL